jgi:hypothetical protein
MIFAAEIFAFICVILVLAALTWLILLEAWPGESWIELNPLAKFVRLWLGGCHVAVLIAILYGVWLAVFI